MVEAGFFEQKRHSPAGLALVVVVHAAVLSALVLIKGPDIMRRIFEPIEVTLIPVPPLPDEVTPPDRRPDPADRLTFVDQTRPVLPENDNTGQAGPTEPPPIERVPERPIELAARPELPPVRRDAEIVGSNLKPPYPASEERAQRGGVVRIRVTIGADGRVRAAERVSATSDAFWRATERQALSRWRFRPATLDGRPVESTRVMTVTFRIDEA
jgi:protein TonB